MSTAIFPFKVDPAAQEVPNIPTAVHVAEDGTQYALGHATKEQLDQAYSVTFGKGSPNDSAGDTYATLFAFYLARQQADSFYFKAWHAVHREVLLGALGTGDTVETVFAFADGTDLHKYVDASTLKVYKDAVLQTITTHYTIAPAAVNGVYVSPVVTFVAAPAAVDLTVSYEYYRQVRFTGPITPVFAPGAAAETLASVGPKRVGVAVKEIAPGGSYA